MCWTRLGRARGPLAQPGSSVSVHPEFLACDSLQRRRVGLQGVGPGAEGFDLLPQLRELRLRLRSLHASPPYFEDGILAAKEGIVGRKAQEEREDQSSRHAHRLCPGYRAAAPSCSSILRS